MKYYNSDNIDELALNCTTVCDESCGYMVSDGTVPAYCAPIDYSVFSSSIGAPFIFNVRS